MLGMSFLSFLVLTVIAAVVAVAYHDVFGYRFVEGGAARFGKLILGWLGAWLGSPVFGHWFWKVENVFIFPAIIGAVAAIHLSVMMWKTSAKIAEMRPAMTGGAKEEIRAKTPMAA